MESRLVQYRRYSEKEKTPHRSPHPGAKQGAAGPGPKGPSPDKALKKEVHYEDKNRKPPGGQKRNHKKSATPPKAGKPLPGMNTSLGQDQNKVTAAATHAVIPLGKEELFDYLREHGLPFRNVEHPPVFTVEAMLPYLEGVVEGAICKNLFLVDKRSGRLYLLAAEHSRAVRLADVARLVGAKELRLASEAALYAALGVRQGCVTAFALLNDAAHAVSGVLVDAALLDESRHPAVNFHPLVNTATTSLATSDFCKFLALTGHTVIQF